MNFLVLEKRNKQTSVKIEETRLCQSQLLRLAKLRYRLFLQEKQQI